MCSPTGAGICRDWPRRGTNDDRRRAGVEALLQRFPRGAVKRRDRAAVREMIARDFYYLSSGEDEDGDGDTREEAFRFWDEPRIGGWAALEKVLAQGAVPNTALRAPGSRRPSRVAPPAANSRRAISRRGFDWYAVFEFRGGRWYCTVFNQCCD